MIRFFLSGALNMMFAFSLLFLYYYAVNPLSVLMVFAELYYLIFD